MNPNVALFLLFAMGVGAFGLAYWLGRRGSSGAQDAAVAIGGLGLACLSGVAVRLFSASWGGL